MILFAVIRAVKAQWIFVKVTVVFIGNIGNCHGVLSSGGHERLNLVSIVFISIISSHFPLQKPQANIIKFVWWVEAIF